jgi:hypothetical protein
LCGVARPLALKPKNVLGGNKQWFNTSGHTVSAHLWFGRESQAALQKLVPNATYLTVLRKPLVRFVSAFAYYGTARGMVGRHISPAADPHPPVFLSTSSWWVCSTSSPSPPACVP